MKINTKLKMAVLAPALMAFIVSLTLVFSHVEMAGVQENGDIVRRIRNSIAEINVLVRTYAFYHEERPKQQLLAEHDKLMSLISGVKVRDPEQQQLLVALRSDSRSMKETFLRLISVHENAGSYGSSGVSAEAEERLVGQLLVRYSELDTGASRLRRLVDDGIRKTQAWTTALIFIVMAGTTIPLMIGLFLMMRSTSASLAVLRRGTEVVGAGNLDYRISLSGRDELAELARSFDEMTDQLQKVTVSKDQLQREMEERKRAEAQREKLIANLEAANRELEAFTYSVSHDLRAPLRAIDGFSRMLLNDIGGSLDPESKRKFDVISVNAQKMGQLIDDLLVLSRTQRTTLSMSAIDMNLLVQDVRGELWAGDPDRNIEFRVGDLPPVCGDRMLLRQALSNILGNAVKFTSNTDRALIEISGANSGDFNTYCVRDNGVGFDMRYYDKMFEVFHRLHSEKDYEGTGVGLAIVKKIIERHGGRIFAEGKPGEGAAFYFMLPAGDI